MIEILDREILAVRIVGSITVGAAIRTRTASASNLRIMGPPEKMRL